MTQADRTMRDAANSLTCGGTPDAVWERHFDEALADASIPTLLMVLVQLTGDTRWIGPRYQ